ncbi:MAG: hypothetical protein KGJ98_03180 [Chloroflexota bacterium]|nr:hypothetical protein [Chloroflexota bacterium]MDE3101218.1 hypothetical protein [Chloroflexota bacterium]
MARAFRSCLDDLRAPAPALLGDPPDQLEGREVISMPAKKKAAKKSAKKSAKKK